MNATCRFDHPRRAAAALAALVAFWGAAGSAWGAAYRILDLGTLGGELSYATGINNSGQVVGYAWTASDLPHAFRTAPNQPIDPATDDLGTLGGVGSLASGINERGQVVGQDLSLWHAFRTGPNQPINPATDDLGPSYGYSYATGINDSGQVVGFANVSGRNLHFRTGPNQPINPTTDDVGSALMVSMVSGINSSGQVVGAYWPIVSEVCHAFRTGPNQPFNPATDDLGTLGVGIFDWSEARGINDSGQVVGVSGHAFRTGPNQPIIPATDDLGWSSAYAINASGQVVGDDWSSDTGWGEPQEPQPFVYSGNGPMQNLNELIDPASGWMLYRALDINDLGQIVGWGIHNGNERAFLLTPVPEPASLVLLGGCLVGLSSLRRRR